MAPSATTSISLPLSRSLTPLSLSLSRSVFFYHSVQRSSSNVSLLHGTKTVGHPRSVLTSINHHSYWCFQVITKGSVTAWSGTTWVMSVIRRRKTTWTGIDITRTSVKGSNASTADVVSPRRQQWPGICATFADRGIVTSALTARWKPRARPIYTDTWDRDTPDTKLTP